MRKERDLQPQISDEPSFPLAWDVERGDPATALALALGRLAIDAPPEKLQAAFDRQANPSSLKALIDVAGQLGLEARALRGSVTTLPEISLPAIIHLQSAPDAAPGFALLVERDDEAVVIEEGERRDRHLLSLTKLADVWTGVIVTLAPRPRADRSAPKGPEPAAPAWLALAPLPRTIPAALWARRLGFTALVALAVGGGFRMVVAGQTARGLAVIFATALFAIATLISAVLSQHAHAGHGSEHGTLRPVLLRVCGRGGLLDCASVLGSRFGTFLGIPLADFGLAFFATALVLAAAGAVLPQAITPTWYAALALYLVPSLPMALFCTVVQVYPLRRFCPLCLVVHAAAVTATAVLGAAFLLRASAPLAAAEVLPLLAFAGVAFIGGLGGHTLLVAFAEETRAARARLTRIDGDALGALAEWRGRPALPLPAPDSPFLLGDRESPVRLDVLLDPGCAACGEVADRLTRFVSLHPDAHVVVHLPARASATPADRALRVALTGLGSLDAFLLAKEQLADGELPSGSDPQTLAAHLALGRAIDVAAATAAQAEADRLFARVGTGTPVLLVAGRIFMGGFGELGLALSRYRAAF